MQENIKLNEREELLLSIFEITSFFHNEEIDINNFCKENLLQLENLLLNLFATSNNIKTISNTKIPDVIMSAVFLTNDYLNKFEKLNINMKEFCLFIVETALAKMKIASTEEYSEKEIKKISKKFERKGIQFYIYDYGKIKNIDNQ